MSRSLTAVIGITLGLPILAMIAVSVSSGLNPDLLMRFLIGAVVATFVVCAIFEIKRMADLDRHRDTEQPNVLPDEAHAAPEAYEAEPPLPAVSTLETSPAVVLPEASATDVEEVHRAGVEPIAVEALDESAVATTKAKSGAKAEQRKRSNGNSPVVPASHAALTGTKGKRKGGRRPTP
jgi:hypothetical protein